MMTTKLFGPECEWVFVGCGGTFFMAAPMYSVLLHKYKSYGIVVIDPDETEAGNSDRQWPGQTPGQEKAHQGYAQLRRVGIALAERFNSGDEVLFECTGGRAVVAIVNVDNDQTRLDVHSWLASRSSDGVMIDSGCEADYGQSWAGIWLEGQCMHDWAIVHPDVGVVRSTRANRCTQQTAMSNLMTATCSALMIEEVAQWLRKDSEGQGAINEYEWEAWPPLGEIKFWNTATPVQAERDA